MTANEAIAIIAYDILCTLNAEDYNDEGIFFPILQLHDDLCFNGFNHGLEAYPNGLCILFNETLKRMIDKELIWKEYVGSGDKTHPIYGMYAAGHEALRNHKDCKVYV